MGFLSRYQADFVRGYKTHSTAYAIMEKYGSPCEEASEELVAAGISLEDWRRLSKPEPSLEGILYLLGGVASWFRFGMSE